MPVREYYQAHKEEVREKARKYRAKNKEMFRQQWKKDFQKYLSEEANKVKNRARVARHKKMPVRQQCQITECETIGEAHHDDYSKPLDVRWLCKLHHEELHHKEII